MPRDENEKQRLERLIAETQAIGATSGSSSSPSEGQATKITTSQDETKDADPLGTLAEFRDNVGWFNRKMRWIRNAWGRVENGGGRVAGTAVFVWDHGLKQTFSVAAKLGIFTGKKYASAFNWAVHKKDKETGERHFMKWRAATAVGVTVLAPVGLYYAVPLVIRPTYDVTMRLTSERNEQLYLWNPEPVEGYPYTWSISASKTPDREDSFQIILRRNLAYARFSRETEGLFSKLSDQPELFDTTLTGFRFKLGGDKGLGLDLHPEAQNFKLLEGFDLNEIPQPSS